MRGSRVFRLGVGLTSALALNAAAVQTREALVTVAESSVRGHMESLAGDDMKGRGSGTEDELRAATYIAVQLQRCAIGALDKDAGHLHTVDLPPRQVSAPPTLTAGRRTYTHGVDMLVRWVGVLSAAGPLVTYSAGVQVVPGAVVLVNADEPGDRETAAASAVLVKEPGLARLPPRAGGIPVPIAANRAWQIAVTDATYAALKAMPDGTPIRLRATAQPVRTWNVFARLPGRQSEPDRQSILLHAHIDHLGVRGDSADRIHNGADDNASGVTAVLELACALSRMPQTNRTFVFAWFGSEETGGQGARHFAENEVERLGPIAASLGFEMLGRPDPRVRPQRVWLTGYERSTLGAALVSAGAPLAPDPYGDRRFFFRTDSIHLAYRGIVAHTLSSYALHGDYHTPADELSRIDYAHLTAVIQSMLDPLHRLADAAVTPEWLPEMQPRRR